MTEGQECSRTEPEITYRSGRGSLKLWFPNLLESLVNVVLSPDPCVIRPRYKFTIIIWTLVLF